MAAKWAVKSDLACAILLQICAEGNWDKREKMHGIPVTGCQASVLVS